MLTNLLDPRVVLKSLQEVEAEIRADGIGVKEKALLFHQLGSLHGLMGDRQQQKNAWQRALLLDPQNETIKESLNSLI